MYVFARVTLPLMAPALALLLFRDTIFSFQANFVPALLIFDGGSPALRDDLSAALRLHECVRVSALRVRGCSDPRHVRRHGADRPRAVADSRAAGD